MNILITEPEHYSEKALGLYRFAGTVKLGVDRDRSLKDQVEGVNVLVIRLRFRIDREVLDAATDLQVIVTPTTGLDHLDLKELDQKGIRILSLKGETEFLRSIPATAELTWGLLLAVRRGIVPAASSVTNRIWERDLFRGRDLKGKVLGIVGCGRIGSIMVGYAKAFGMTVLVHDLQTIQIDGVDQVPLQELYRRSDVVSIHLPLEEETRGFVDRAAFTEMKDGAVFLNTARSGIVDENEMLEALKSGKLAGVGVDVISGEDAFAGKVPEKHPLLEYADTAGNLVITPHIGGASWDSMHATEDFCAERFVDLCRDADL
ncbi:NAD(P)-dependent oxidoreductase [Puniceicoccus vermicola]|uniref:Hydroxyacid dehydrogenase n=1 Tax=Puniceicoccus vermicola TaxID=388746 RepID=A0A7X1AY55_9BACT|nr:NAD(P)-dependent oxidoreductase [Puniceicoccus vermicola]MBC2601093.1 hypothetical protein [Puniceicoccus vermicola]